jgi:hypothetical protein
MVTGWSDYTKSDEFKRKIANVERWRSLVDEVQAEEGYDFDTDKIMAIIAQESGGDSGIVSDDEHGSVGLMQCTPQPWTASESQLKNPKVNIQCGLWILTNAMRAAEGDWHNALRFYNCGAARGKELPNCGANYAERVLNFWLPHFRTMIIIIPICTFRRCIGFMIYDQDNDRTYSLRHWKAATLRDYGYWERGYERETLQRELRISIVQ